MENKILLQDLFAGVSQRSGSSKKDGEVFVRSFFEIIEQFLLQDKIVKIKGLGTFKIVEVSGRDSVNVNTGERIHIQGHSKITFTPDTSLRDHVNRPFADFETVILNEGVDLAAMEYVNPESEDLEEETVETNNFDETKSSELQVSDNENIIEKNSIEESTSDASESADSDTSEDKASEENVALIEEPVSVQEAVTKFVEVEPVIEQEVVKQETVEQEADEQEVIEEEADVKQVVDDEPVVLHNEDPESAEIDKMSLIEGVDDQEEERDGSFTHAAIDNRDSIAKNAPVYTDSDIYGSPKGKILKYILVLLLSCLLLALGYWAGTRHVFGDECASSSTDNPVQTTNSAANNGTSFQSAQEAKAGSDSTLNDSRSEETKKDSQVKKDSEKDSQAFVNDDFSNKDKDEVSTSASNYPQVPGGEYEIVGIKHVHRVKAGESVNAIARKYFGEMEMSVYIIKLNKLKNPEVIEIGDELKIPNLRKK